MALAAAFARPPSRLAAADRLARWLGVDHVLIYLRDPELPVLIPAAGFPQTVAAGPRWRAFVASDLAPGVHRADVDPCAGHLTPATALVDAERTAIVLLGGAPIGDRLTALRDISPLIGALVRTEHGAAIARAESAVAFRAGVQANDLTIALDIARRDLEIALAESERLNAELHDTDQRKDEFLAMLGHELRNPIAAVVAALAVLDDPALAAAHTRAREIVSHQMQQLERLVDDLLDVARISRGKVELHLEELEVEDSVRRAVDTTQVLFSSRQHALRIEVRDRVWVCADRTRLEQMITNLLTNAAKYTNPGGSIVIRISRDRDDAVIDVEDNGIGIPAADLPHVFDAFLQVAPSIDRTAGGLGVGLTMVSRLARLHGGRVDAVSEVGVGSCFTLRLPAGEARCVEPRPAAGSGPVHAATRHVLVVDDNVDSAEMLVAIVESWGHAACHAHDGPSAIEVARAEHPDVILLDIGLPGMDGYQVAATLRADPAMTTSKIIAVSGYGLPSDRERGRAAGFDDHLVKPVDLAALRRRIG